jgi:carbon monoxide dehydrogenase subunit G
VKVEREIDIAASPERVYDVVMDPQCLKQWVSIHDSLDEAPEGQLREGSQLAQCLKLAGRKFHVRWTVAENEPARRVVWEGKGPVRSRARVEYEFAENGDGTHFSYANEYHLPGGPLAGMAGPVVRRVAGKELDRSLEALKRLVEKS